MGLSNGLLFLILVTLTFNSTTFTKTDVTIASYNMHGFSTSAKYLKDSIQHYGGIWMIQEHWLGETQLPQLKQLGVQFVARSGVEDVLSTGIYRGRPFGGVCIAWSPKLNNFISPVSNFKHKRIVAVELKTSSGNYILINVYMPFFNSSRKDFCMSETNDAISMVELLIENYPHHHCIIGGDFNTEFRNSCLFDPLWQELIVKKQFELCDNLFLGPG